MLILYLIISGIYFALENCNIDNDTIDSFKEALSIVQMNKSYIYPSLGNSTKEMLKHLES